MSAGETIVAIYDGFEDANAVLQALLDEGFLQSDVGLAVSNPNGAFDQLDFRLKQFEIIDDEENGFGALLAGLGGAFYSPRTIEIPGLGKTLAAGPLVDLLGEETSSVVGGITASLVHLGIPHHEAGYYADAIGRGYALITVHIRTEKAMVIALDILRRNHPMTLKNGSNQWMGFDEPKAMPAYDGVPEVIGHFPYVRMSFS